MALPLTAENIARAPKVLLHDHLDGGLRPQTVLELADDAGYRDLPADEPEALGRWFRESADSGSLVRYLETFAHTVAVMQRPEAVQRVARECALDLAADGVVYAEVRMAPELLTTGGMSLDEVVEAMLDGYAQGSREAAAAGHPIVVGTLLCAMRQADRWVSVAEQVVRRRGEGVVGFDLAGPEDGFPPDRIPEAIAVLDRADAHRTIHAGEAAGIDSIVAALDGARAERLGHGVRIADQVPAGGALGPVAERVRDEQMTLEVAPSSNVQTGAYSSLAEHPVDRLHRAGFTVTVNTDNRLMSGVSVTSELTDVARTFGWGWDDVQTVAERALRAGFADDAVRARIATEVLRPGFDALRGGS
jgi:adenosine deaminase